MLLSRKSKKLNRKRNSRKKFKKSRKTRKNRKNLKRTRKNSRKTRKNRKSKKGSNLYIKNKFLKTGIKKSSLSHKNSIKGVNDLVKGGSLEGNEDSKINIENIKNIDTFFDKIYYINLKRRPDRKNHIEEQLNKYTNNYTRFDAYDGQILDLNNLDNNIIHKNNIKDVLSDKKTMGITLTLGAIGCAMSHRSIWEKIANSNYEKVLILEDDIEINDNIYNFNSIYNEVPKDWDILYIGSGQYIKNEKITNNIFKLDHAYCLYGYIINSRSARKLLDNIFPLKQQIDSSIYLNKNINAYIVEPVMITRIDLKTDIQIY